MALLEIIQQVNDSLALLPKINSVESDDATIRQLVAFCNEEGQNLVQNYSWQELIRQAKVPASNLDYMNYAIDLGLLEELAPNFSFFINDTFYLDDLPFKLEKLNIQQVANLEALKSVGIYWAYWFEAGHLFISKSAKINQSIMFRYQTKNWVKEDKYYANKDSDQFYLSERILALGITWRWLQRQGLQYEQEYNNYSQALNQLIGRDVPKSKLNALGANNQNGISVGGVYKL